MTQKERLLKAFRSGEKLSTYSATVKKLTTKLPTRVGEFEQDGYRFIKTWVVPKKVKAHFVYELDKKNTKKNLQIQK